MMAGMARRDARLFMAGVAFEHPDPDSTERTSVSPAPMVKLTSFTARSTWLRPTGKSRPAAAAAVRRHRRAATDRGADGSGSRQRSSREDPTLLDHYDCLVCVGHEMRDAVDAFRLEQANTRRVCFKQTAATHHPLTQHNDNARPQRYVGIASKT
jgi:hypothetical protein